MDFTLIETRAYEELRALIIRISERIASLSALSTRMQPDRWMTLEEVLTVAERTHDGVVEQLRFRLGQRLVGNLDLGEHLFQVVGDMRSSR